MSKYNKPVVFQERVYVSTERGIRRASATPEEMDTFDQVDHVDAFPLFQQSSKKISRNRKSTGAWKKKNTPLPYDLQQEIAERRKTKKQKRMARFIEQLELPSGE